MTAMLTPARETDALHAENDRLRGEVAALSKRLGKTQDAARRLEAALEAFASDENWRLGGPCDPNSPSFVGTEIASAALADGKGDAMSALDQKLTFIYRNWKGEVAERTVEPCGIWIGETEWHPERQWFLTAMDTDKGELRDFALKDCNFQGLVLCPPGFTRERVLQTADGIEALGRSDNQRAILAEAAAMLRAAVGVAE